MDARLKMLKTSHEQAMASVDRENDEFIADMRSTYDQQMRNLKKQHEDEMASLKQRVSDAEGSKSLESASNEKEIRNLREQYEKDIRDLNNELAESQKGKTTGAGRLRSDVARLQKELDKARDRGDKERTRAVELQKKVRAYEIDDKIGIQKQTVDETEEIRRLKNTISDLEDQLSADKERNTIRLEELRAKNELLEQSLL